MMEHRQNTNDNSVLDSVFNSNVKAKVQPVHKPFRPHLAKNRYGREDMLALYHSIVDDEGMIERPAGDDFIQSESNPWLTPKGFHEPINLQPLTDQDQHAFRNGINSAL